MSGMDIQNFAEKVRSRIKELRLSQTELGERIGWPRSQVSDMLRENRPPKPDKLIDLADALKVPVDYLIDDRIVSESGSGILRLITEDEERILHYARVLGLDLAEKRLLGVPEGEDGGKRYNREWGGTPIEEEAKNSPKKPKPGSA